MISRSATDAPVAFGFAPLPDAEHTNLELARQYLAAIETASAPDSSADLLRFFAPDVIQVVYPNQLLPHGGTADLDAIVKASERGRKTVRAQRYEVHSVLASADRVALEVLWVGTLAMPIGTLPEGAEMRAHFAVFLTFRDGRIIRQHNYDCFDPF